MLRHKWVLLTQGLLLIFLCGFFIWPQISSALNIVFYKDVLTDSGPLENSNHTLSFQLNTNLSPSSVFEITPPSGFEVLATSTFAERNVEMYVNGVPRVADTVAAPGIDQIEITPGSPGFFRYTLAPDSGITSGSQIQIMIGNQTSGALDPVTTFSTSTGTTTTAGDIEPIVNSADLGTHEVLLEIYDGGLVAKEEFVIFLNEKVNIPSIDTTEEIPPYRFNGAPTSSVSGTTLSVELSFETDELAYCKYDTVAGTAFSAMPNVFSNTGIIFHSQVVTVAPLNSYSFYIRCIDDEGNFNIDDYVITFDVTDIPDGSPNTDGTTDGDGSGTGDSGTGGGSGSGSTDGSSSGSGGSGGGGGGGTGNDSGNTAGGGFESTDAPYQSGDARVIISGTAYPNSTVGVLVDGKFFDTTKAGSTGSYSITLDQIARGVYTFGVYAEGPNKIKSSTFSTSFTVTGARTSALSNINVAPSILVSPDPVNPGQTLTVSGYALPNSNVTIQNGKINSTILKTLQATADGSGKWSTTIDTASFSVSTYQVRAKSEQIGGSTTNYSEYTFYGVGQAADLPINADLNRDGKVNLTDFSILLFWWNTNGGDSNPPADINRDGKVSLTDFSILLFNWTG